MNKLKCQIHNQLAFGQVADNTVCFQCDCFNMVYCQNLKYQETQKIIKLRLKKRREFKQLEFQRQKIISNQKQLITQYEEEDDSTRLQQEYDRKLKELKILNNKIYDGYQSKQSQLNQLKQQLLHNFENICTKQLEMIENAIFIIHHMSKRQKWKIDFPMEVKSAVLQRVEETNFDFHFYCDIVGNQTLTNKPLQGYYIVFIHSIIYDGYWKNGTLIYGTMSYIEGNGDFQSYDASDFINKQPQFLFNNCFNFFHSLEDHFRYIQINNQQLIGIGIHRTT